MLLALALSSLVLPAAAQEALSREVPGWRLAPPAPQLVAWLSESKLGWEPNLVEADFDGDGRADYAVRVIVPRGQTQVIVLMKRGTGFAVFHLAEDPQDPFTCLALYRRGEKDFDFERMKPFRYNHDSLGILYSHSTAMTFSWTGAGFERRAAPGDEEVEAAAH
jgi:hypothetical protein